MKAYDDTISDEVVVSEALKSLNKRFDHIVAAIEKSHDLSTIPLMN